MFTFPLLYKMELDLTSCTVCYCTIVCVTITPLTIELFLYREYMAEPG